MPLHHPGRPALFATFAGTLAPTQAHAQDLFVSNLGSGTISRITPTGNVSTFVSGLSGPTGLAFDASNNLYVGSESGIIYRVTPAGGLTTFASGFSNIYGLAFAASGNLFAADFDGTIRKITPGGAISTFASGLSNPTGVAFDTAGDLYVSNYVTNSVLR